MKVRYGSRYSGERTEDLKTFLQPTSTGSDQGSLEQLNAEISALKTSVGEILAVMVEKEVVTFEQACDMAGMHQWYREYNFKNLEVVQE